MAMFSLSKSQEIADLQASISGLTTERDSLANAADEFRATIETITAERDAALALVTTSQAAAAAAEEALASRVAEIEAAAAAQVDSEVISRLAAAGTDPIARDPDAKEANESNSMKISDFRKLPAHKANAFIRSGGKLAD